MTCPFCDQPLLETQTVSCSRRPCVLAAKRARGRARREADPTKRLKSSRDADGRAWNFPPELEYLDQDAGIGVDQMARCRTDPTFRMIVLTRRARRANRLKERIAAVSDIA